MMEETERSQAWLSLYRTTVEIDVFARKDGDEVAMGGLKQ